MEAIQSLQLTLEYVKKRFLDEQVNRANSSHADESGHVSDAAFAGKNTGLKLYGFGKFGHKQVPNLSPNESGRQGNGQIGGKSHRKSMYRANVSEETKMAFVATTVNWSAVTRTMADVNVDWYLDSGARAFSEELRQ